MGCTVLLLFLALIVSWNTALSTPDRKQEEDLRRVLKAHVDLSQEEVEAIRKGKGIVRDRPAGVKQEISLLGIVRIDVPAEFFVRMAAREGMNLETSAALSRGRFSASPRLEDVRAVSLPLDELGELTKGVSPGCKVKASSVLAGRFGGLDASSPDFEDCANDLIREVLVAYVEKYLREGDRALITYEDKAVPVRLADEFRSLIEASPPLGDPFPDIYRYLGGFPNRWLGFAESALYWTMEHFDPQATRPVLSLNHLVFYREPSAPQEMIVISKQLYATHYYEASLGVTMVWDAPASDGPALYLMHINRSRIDILREIPRILAGSIRRGARDMLRERMSALKTNLEDAYRTGGPSREAGPS
ncbi:MAG: hypothetical protein JW821_14795 [Deltaproteobacteria bacterium]|nr:hypothetical protein [Deltaproteobacteria bacterium]